MKTIRNIKLLVPLICLFYYMCVSGAQSTSDSQPLSFMFGEWVGIASGVGPDRKPYVLTQTERIGPMLGGQVTVIEGAGYDESGVIVFNAFAIVSTSRDGKMEMRSYTDGHSGTYPFHITENGFVWSTPAGPNAKMQYTATFREDRWNQIGEYIKEGEEPIETFKMDLLRIGQTTWPSAGAIDPKQSIP